MSARTVSTVASSGAGGEGGLASETSAAWMVDWLGTKSLPEAVRRRTGCGCPGRMGAPLSSQIPARIVGRAVLLGMMDTVLYVARLDDVEYVIVWGGYESWERMSLYAAVTVVLA